MFNKVLNAVEQLSPSKVLIHSDVMRGFPVKYTNRKQFINTHFELLEKTFINSQLFMPSFNYDFCKGKPYLIEKSPSQLGVLSEYFRVKISDWRTEMPVFSFTGTGVKPEINLQDTLDPFDENSVFHTLNSNESIIMHYGSEIWHSTIIHYVERLSKRLNYRYDKVFIGNVVDEKDNEHEVRLKYHVRPLGRYFEYDWIKIYQDLKNVQILFEHKDINSNILLIKTKELVHFWLEKLKENNLYFLDKKSLAWITPFLDKLGRKFLITDFEKS